MVKKFFSLNLKDQMLLAQCSAALVISYLLIYFLPTAALLKIFRPNLSANNGPGFRSTENELLYAKNIQTICRNLFFEPRCLAICSAYCLLLRLHKIYPLMSLGFTRVSSTGSGNLIFHSWIIISEDLILGERHDLDDFNMFSKINSATSPFSENQSRHV